MDTTDVQHPVGWYDCTEMKTESRRVPTFTEELKQKIIESIRTGAYDWVACSAAGISVRLFNTWKEKAKAGIHPYVDFWEEIEQARSEARGAAEKAVYETMPFAWLRYGPGRERQGEPGWTESREVSGPDGGPIPIAAIDSILAGLPAPSVPSLPEPSVGDIIDVEHTTVGPTDQP